MDGTSPSFHSGKEFSGNDVFYSHKKIFEIGELRAIFDCEWMLNWKSNYASQSSFTGYDDKLDLSPLLGEDGLPRRDLMLKKNVIALPLEWAEVLFSMYQVTPASKREAQTSTSSNYDCPNVGLVYQTLSIDQPNPNIYDILDFSCMELKYSIKGYSSVQTMVVAPKLKMGDLMKRLLATEVLKEESYHISFHYFIDSKPCSMEMCGKEALLLQDLPSTLLQFTSDDNYETRILIEPIADNCSRQQLSCKLKKEDKAGILQKIHQNNANPMRIKAVYVPQWWLDACCAFLNGDSDSEWPGPMPPDISWPGNRVCITQDLLDVLVEVFGQDTAPNECNSSQSSSLEFSSFAFTDCRAPAGLSMEDDVDSAPHSFDFTSMQNKLSENDKYSSTAARPRMLNIKAQGLKENLKYYSNMPLSDVYDFLLKKLWSDEDAQVPLLFRAIENATPDGSIEVNYMQKLEIPLGELPDCEHLVLLLKHELPSTQQQQQQQQPHLQVPLSTSILEEWADFKRRFLNIVFEMTEMPFEKHAMMVGLDNLGSSCYFNAVLQCLFQLQPIREIFSSDSELIKRMIVYPPDKEPVINPTWHDTNKQELIFWFLHAWAFVNQGKYPSYRPNEIMSHFSSLHPDFSAHTANDALFFYTHFIECLHDFTKIPLENKQVKMALRLPGKDRLTMDELEPSLITEFFAGKLLSTRRCNSCFHQTEATQSARFLTVPLTRTVDLCVVFMPTTPWNAHCFPSQLQISVSQLNSVHEILCQLQPLYPHVVVEEWMPFIMQDNFEYIWQLPRSTLVSSIIAKKWETIYFYQMTEPAEFYFLQWTKYKSIGKNKPLAIPPMLLPGHIPLQKSYFHHNEHVIHFLSHFEFVVFSKHDTLSDALVGVENMISRGSGIKIVVMKLEIKPTDMVNWPPKASTENVSLWPSTFTRDRNKLDLKKLLQIAFMSNNATRVDGITCEKCHESQHFGMSMTLLRLPPILVIHLRRFKPRRDDIVKDSTPVDCPLNLDLSDLVTPSNKQRYELVGVVSHYGDSLHNGHYTAQCLRQLRHPKPRDQWLLFDDARVSSLPFPKVEDSFVLFYTRSDL